MLRSHIITSTDELADHQGRWEDLRRECGGTIYSSHALVSSWFKCFGHKVKPRVVLVEEGDELVGVAPMSFHRYTSMGIPIKVLAIAGEVSPNLWLPTASIMFRPGRKDVLDRLLKEIGRMDWNTLTAFHLLDTPATRCCLDSIRSNWFSTDHRLEKSYKLTFPEAGDISKMFDRKARENLRNRMNKLRREKGDVEFRSLPAGMVDEAAETYARQHIERYGSRGGSWFRFPENVQFLKDIARKGVEEGYGFVHEMSIDGEVAAQSFGFYEGNTALPYRYGMNDAFVAYSPGWQLQLWSFARFREMGFKHCSLGVGDEPYKYCMGGTESTLLGIMARRGTVGLLERIARSQVASFIGGRFGRKS